VPLKINKQQVVRSYLFNFVFFITIQKCVKADAEQTFISAIMASDADSDNAFSDQEVKMLELRLQQIPGVDIHPGILATRLAATKRTMAEVMNLLKELYDDTIPDEERIFVVKAKQLLKS
jgi:hypothetical protein